MNPKHSLPPLTAPQTPVIAAAVRYRVLAAAPLREILGSPSDEAVEKSMKRLKRRGWLFQLQLPARRSAYTLSRDAVLTLGITKKALKAMGRDAVVSNLAMLCYCAKKKVERLTPDEVRSGIPELARPGLQVGNFFTDASTTPPRLTWMLVDRGSSPHVLVRKAGTVVKKAYRLASMRELMLGQQFAIVVLVPNERKKWLVERVLAKRFFPQVKVSVEVIPDIQDLLLS
jgi:hypothetical protein